VAASQASAPPLAHTGEVAADAASELSWSGGQFQQSKHHNQLCMLVVLIFVCSDSPPLRCSHTAAILPNWQKSYGSWRRSGSG
jgi:hypothetical protein